MIIEAEWKASPASGITQIDIQNDLGYSKKEWGRLSFEKQKEIIQNYLLNNEEEIIPKLQNIQTT